ncbi:helix-turn-helix transcriptional regulator [Labrenzia sp. R4_1]|uniref:helix-turn-helix transcriptional regulator n=1 Tax=Labrenzia sp. R4_1 TaxID=2821106 RepID=UPI001ADA4FF6|nr:helix-turn-helix transcriptional regulator [Labrenzia sp. R4_1]MBO9423759.1 helix-turn-helix transcriptional regulator [Labrenzia sp. R4_1]
MEEASSVAGYEILKDADDIAQFLQASTGMQPEYLQLSRGHANLQYRWIDLAGVTLLWGHSESRAIWRDQMANSGLHFGYVVSSDGSVSVRGKDLRHDQAMVWLADQEMEYILPGSVLVVEIGVEQHILDELGWRFHGDALAKVSYQNLCSLTRTCVAAHQVFHWTANAQTEYRERILDDLEPVLAPWMTQNLVTKTQTRQTSIPYSHFQKARAVLDHRELNEQIRIEEICKTLGIPRSTLHYAFRQAVGIGPRRYFELVRLQGARKTLLSADRGHTTIAAIALDYGFSDFGRFSKLYNAQFNEMPSQTLAK